MKTLLLTLLTILGCYAFSQEVREAEQPTEPSQVEEEVEQSVETQKKIEEMSKEVMIVSFPLQSCRPNFEEGTVACMTQIEYLKTEFCPKIMETDNEQQ